jgi:hypothetical protein
MIDHVMRSRDGMKIHVVELFDPLRIEYCTFWFYSVVEKARHLFITIKQCSNHSRPSVSDVQPLLEVACIQSEGVSSGNQLELVYLALKIKQGGRMTPEAPIYSIEVIHS